MNAHKKSFDAGFTAGYALGQSHAGEGGYWIEPLTRDKAWEEFLKSRKKSNSIDEDDDVTSGDEEIPY